MVDVSIFMGICGLIFASITTVGYFIKVGRNLEEKSEEIVKEKALILECFLKTFSGISVRYCSDSSKCQRTSQNKEKPFLIFSRVD